MDRILPKEVDCKRTSAGLDEILPYVFDYTRRKHIIDRQFKKYYELEDEWKEYPDEWEDNILGMLALSALFGSVKRASAFTRSMKSDLSDIQLSMVRRWRKHPWFYCVFTVLEEYDGNLLEIQPIGDPPDGWPSSEFPESILLYSPNVTDNFRHGKQLFIALLWEGERAFHTYGAILNFNSINKEDIHFFADIVRHRDYSALSEPLMGIKSRTTDLSDTILSEPLSFLQLFRFTETPIMESRAGRLQQCVSVEISSSLTSIKDKETLRRFVEGTGEKIERIEFGEYAAVVYPGEGSPMYDPVLYLSFTDQRIFLSAMTEEGYLRGRNAAGALCTFPEEPQLRASMPIFTAAHKILDYEDEFCQIQDSFNDIPKDQQNFNSEGGGESSDSNLPTFEELQAIMNRLTENHNEGIEEDDISIAESLDVSTDKVTALREKFNFDTVSSGQADRLGLSPRAFRQLSAGGMPAAKGALLLRKPEEVRDELAALGLNARELLSKVPIFRFAQWILSTAVESGSIAATKAGYVETKVIMEALEQNIIPTPLDKIMDSSLGGKALSKETLVKFFPKKENDWKEFLWMRKLLEKARLLNFNGKRFIPGGKAEILLSDPVFFYHHLLGVMFTSYDWDYSPMFGTIPYIRTMAGFLFYAVGILSSSAETDDNNGVSGWFDSELLIDRFISAVPPLAGRVEEEENNNSSMIMRTRNYVQIGILSDFLHKFAENFGLVEIVSLGYPNSSVKPTPLYSVIFGK